MKPKTLATLTVAALALAACSKQTTGPLPTYDLGAAIDNPQPFDLSEIAESIEFIPLDDSQPEALLATVMQLRESPGRFYVTDNGQRPVRVFDRSGRFVGTRGTIGRGPDDFNFIQLIFADPASDNLYIVGRAPDARGSDRQLTIGLEADGKEFARNPSMPRGEPLFSEGGIVWSTGIPSMDAAADGSDNPWTLIETYSPALERTGQFDEPDTGTPRSLTGASFMPTVYTPRATLHGNGSQILVMHAMNDTVRIFRPGTGRGERPQPHLQPAFVLDLGAKTPPASMFGIAPTEVWSARYYRVRDLYEGGRWLFVIVDNMGMNPTSGGKISPVVIDRRAVEGETGGGAGAPGGVGFAPLRPDGEPGFSLGGIPFTVKYVTGNRLVGTIQALDIVDNAASITHPGLRNLAATLREDSNPVIVTVTLKQ